ncbi:MAG: MMPL family transporter [Nocardioides sp.]|nr:MMPL family transporter [Nocardioides sp.]
MNAVPQHAPEDPENGGAKSTRGAKIGRGLVGRRGAWIVLTLAVFITAGLMGVLSTSTPPGAATSLPDGAQSTEVKELETQFPDADQAPVVAVFTRTDGRALTDQDLSSIRAAGTAMSKEVGHKASSPMPSEDGEAATVSVLVSTDGDSSEIGETVDELRSIATRVAPSVLKVQITGGPAFGADIAAAFDGANVTLLAITISVVALLLLLTYRSPVLWLVPLVVVALADQVANLVTARAGQVWDLQFDAGIISVLVFGAGTNYALLLISRYRERLRQCDDHREALRTAWQSTAPAILTSNLTVVLSLLTLVTATLPSTRGLGIASAIGLGIALVFALFVLPAALAICGRRLFWPFIPRPGTGRPGGGLWLKTARAVTRQPVKVLAMTLLMLAIFSAGLLGTKVGLSQDEQFRSDSESAAGLETLAEHFPSGDAAPLTVMTKTGTEDEVVQKISDVPDVNSAKASGQSETGWTKITVIGSAEPETAKAYDEVRGVRDAVQDVPDADALVGGANAESLDERDAARHVLLRLGPLILGLGLLMLVGLLRAVLAPVLLIVINLFSAIAAIGAGTWLGTHAFGFPALDVNVPLLAFLFLVALGIDYTIFLTHRTHQLVSAVGTREAITLAVSRTGAVITSAGVVLAAVFAALGVLPLVVLGQLGLIVGLGVLIDTIVVRMLVVPAVFALIGDRIWWPRKPRINDEGTTAISM